MEYNAKYFAKSANIKAMTVWLILCVVLSGAYALEVVKGLREISYYISFLCWCWIPFALGILLLFIKGFDTKYYKDMIAFGYGFFYTYVIFTTNSDLAFTYIIPMAGMLVLYKNRNFMFRASFVNVVVLLLSIATRYKNGYNTPEDITTYEIQVACIILTSFAYVLAINHMSKSEGAMLGAVNQNLDRVVETIKKVKQAGTAVADGVTVVRGLSDENMKGAEDMAQGMNDLTEKNRDLHRETMSSMSMTENIHAQTQNVSSLIEQMGEVIDATVEHTNSSSSELSEVLTSADKMAALSKDAERVLNEFKDEFNKVKQEISTIDGINSQTNLLALNASIEAARAGAAGKGFAVVAEEIRGLSKGTQTSSDRITGALEHLEVTSENLTNSITDILQLIQLTLLKVQQVNTSVMGITADAKQLGDGMQEVDSAMKQVEESNENMLSNMKEICNVMEAMTEQVQISGETTRTMQAKYSKTSEQVVQIDKVMGSLMKELDDSEA